MKLMDLLRESQMKARCPKCGHSKYTLFPCQLKGNCDLAKMGRDVQPSDAETKKAVNGIHSHALCSICDQEWLMPAKSWNTNEQLTTEATQDTPGQVIKKAQLAKVRADASQLGQKQKTLAQSKKNTHDTMTKRRLSKQQADLGVKKADLGIRSAEMSKQLKKPTNESHGQSNTRLINLWLRQHVPFPARADVKNGKVVIGTDIANDLVKFRGRMEDELGIKLVAYGQKNYLTVA